MVLKNKRGYLCLLIVVSLVGGFLGCGRSTGEKETGRHLVICTTTMIADLASQIAGDHVRVVGIMKAGSDPHIYDPTPTDSILLGKADLVLYNGLHLEGRLVQMMHNAGAKAVALAEDPRIKLREKAGATGAPDPHCWWNVRYFTFYAEKVRDALVRLDPERSQEYQDRAAAYIKKLERLDAEVCAAIQRIPKAQRFLITSHDAFYYYGDAYGLTVDAVLGISTDADTRALRLNELARLVIKNNVPAIFHETSVSASLNQMIDRVVELARRDGHGVRVASESLYSDSLGESDTPAGTYIGALRENTRIIVEALAGPAAKPAAATQKTGS